LRRLRSVSNPLRLEPQPFKVVKSPLFLFHQVYNKVTAIQQQPPLFLPSFVPIQGQNVPLVEKRGQLAEETGEVRRAARGGDDEEVGDRGDAADVQHDSILALVIVDQTGC